MTEKSTLWPVEKVALHLILILALAGPGLAQNQDATRINQPLRLELMTMEEEDQKYRKEIEEVQMAALAPDEKQKRLEALWKKQGDADKRNLKRLVEIIEQHGWPGRSMVGKEGSLAAFLIVQHAELEYQKKYFPLLKDAVSKGEARPDHAALLEDRILMREGKKQIYGSQLRQNEVTKKLELWPIEDEERVDARRASVGLGPLAEYLKHFGLEYKPPIKK
jgi:hypothetical protein